jgi:N6-adenosine-specific RNA methylase IME4
MTREVKYKTILSDPPWLAVGGGKIKRGADRHYPLMKTDDIVALTREVLKGKVNEDAHFYIWVINNFLPDGFKVIEALGFRYITCITWLKDKQGLGQYFRGVTEHCLFAVKGHLPYKVVDGRRQQGLTGFFAVRRRHSEKPVEMYQMIEKVSYPPYLELFARTKRKGWDCWGNEV